MKAAAVLLSTALLGAAWTWPSPVPSLSGVRNADGSVTLTWTLPADPSVVGITIFRDRLDAWEEDIIEIVGLTTTYTDVTAVHGESYRYWVHTRDGEGDLSEGRFVEVVDPDDFDDHTWECHGEGAVRPSAGWPFLLAAALAGIAFLPRRLRRVA